MQSFSINGIPTFRVDSTDGHEQTVGVYFRVGSHDEDFATAGLTALSVNMILASLPIEHRDVVDAWFNGLFTHFLISQDSPDPTATLLALSNAIQNIQWDRLEQQKILLQTGDGVVGLIGEAHLFHARYGAVGPGTAWIKKLAYTDATEAMVQRWIDTYFVKQNASIAVVGDVPATTSLPLPEGSAHDFLLLEMLAEHLPARVILEDGENAIGIQLTAPLTATTNIAFSVLADTLHRRLVYMESLTPDLAVESQMLDSNVASFTVIFPIHPANADAAIAAVRQTIEDFGSGLVSNELLDRRRREITDIGRLSESHWAVDQAAQRALFPAVQTLEARALEVATLGPSDFGAVVARASADTLMLATPPAISVTLPLPLFSHLKPAEVDGEKYHLKGMMRWLARDTDLRIGNSGVTYTDRTGPTTINYVNMLAVLDSDVSITVVANTGEMITMFPTAWKEGPQILESLHANVAPERVIKTAPSVEDSATAEAVRRGLQLVSGWRALIPLVLGIFLILNVALLFIGTEASRQSAGVRLTILVALLLVSRFSYRTRRRA